MSVRRVLHRTFRGTWDGGRDSSIRDYAAQHISDILDNGDHVVAVCESQEPGGGRDFAQYGILVITVYWEEPA